MKFENVTGTLYTAVDSIPLCIGTIVLQTSKLTRRHNQSGLRQHCAV